MNNDTLAEFVTALLQMIVAALLPVFLYYARQWLVLQLAKMRQHLTTDQLHSMEWIIRTLVLAAEQSGLEREALATGAAKKKWVVGEAARWLETWGLPVDLSAIDAQIEAIVREFNDGQWRDPPEWPPSLPAQE